MKRTLMSAGLALLALAPVAHAQQGGAAAVPANEALEVMLLRISASSRCTDECVVRGLPYSAERVTESVRVLADGNRIVQRSTEKVSQPAANRRTQAGPGFRRSGWKAEASAFRSAAAKQMWS